jgi:cell division septation protein DedD
VAHTVQDDGFHEIQLNGKQLVFLFMAATVVSVVIFLCGVLVGRGVRTERASVDAPIASSDATPQPASALPTPPPAGSDPTKAAAPPATEDLSYFDRLEKSKAPAEQLKPAATAGSPPPAAAKPVRTAETAPKPAPKSSPAKPEPPKAAHAAPSAAAPSTAPAATDAASSEPGGQGFAVQIAALNVRSEADAIAKRLSSKGYAAYVITPANGTPTVFRVRVGKFPTRREAETIAAKLQKEEQFKPWVTR